MMTWHCQQVFKMFSFTFGQAIKQVLGVVHFTKQLLAPLSVHVQIIHRHENGNSSQKFCFSYRANSSDRFSKSWYFVEIEYQLYRSRWWQWSAYRALLCRITIELIQYPYHFSWRNLEVSRHFCPVSIVYSLAQNSNITARQILSELLEMASSSIFYVFNPFILYMNTFKM